MRRSWDLECEEESVKTKDADRKIARVLAVALPLVVCGCATDRYAEVRAVRIESASAGFTSASAAAVFRNAANQLGFVVQGPIQDPRTPDLLEYSARAPENEPIDKTRLIMSADHTHISFTSGIRGSKEDFAAAKNAAGLFEQALDKRGIHYEVQMGTMPLFWGP